MFGREWALRAVLALATGAAGGLATANLDGGTPALGYAVGFTCFVVILWCGR